MKRKVENCNPYTPSKQSMRIGGISTQVSSIILLILHTHHPNSMRIGEISTQVSNI